VNVLWANFFHQHPNPSSLLLQIILPHIQNFIVALHCGWYRCHNCYITFQIHYHLQQPTNGTTSFMENMCAFCGPHFLCLLYHMFIGSFIVEYNPTSFRWKHNQLETKNSYHSCSHIFAHKCRKVESKCFQSLLNHHAAQ
jgi:hypothetical protein